MKLTIFRKSVVAIDGPRVQFTADASFFDSFWPFLVQKQFLNGLNSVGLCCSWLVFGNVVELTWGKGCGGIGPNEWCNGCQGCEFHPIVKLLTQPNSSIRRQLNSYDGFLVGGLGLRVPREIKAEVTPFAHYKPIKRIIVYYLTMIPR